MDNRKWEADAIASPPTAPASPSDGYPTNGNPLAAQNATEVGDWWFHAIGEEIRAVIVEGGLTPDLGTLTQLRDAIKNMVKGGDYKESVRVASTANVAAISGLLTIDGVTVVAGDRVLLKDQSIASQNGIYVAAAGAWSRAADADTGTELNGGTIIPVEEGTANADTNWQITNNGTVTIGTTGLTFAQVGAQNFASDAEAQGFSIANKPISPATLNAALKGSNQSLAVNGYQKLPGGLIIQWGSTANIAVGATLNVVYPVAFPTACRSFVCLANNILAGVYQFTTNARSLSSTNVLSYSSNSGGSSGVDWIAIGH